MAQVSIISINPTRRTSGSYIEHSLNESQAMALAPGFSSARIAEVLDAEGGRRNSPLRMIARILFGLWP